MATNTSAQQWHPPDFSGLRRIATCRKALDPLAACIRTHKLRYAMGERPDNLILVRTTLAACAVMARASLFSSNCGNMLNRIQPLLREPSTPDGSPTRSEVQAAVRLGWCNVAEAAHLVPGLLRYRDVCDTLRAAFGTDDPRRPTNIDLKTYRTILDELDGATRGCLVPSSDTEQLGNQLRDWGHHVAGLTWLGEPVRLGGMANAIGRRLRINYNTAAADF